MSNIKSAFILLFVCFILIGCQTVNNTPQPGLPQVYSQPAQNYLEKAKTTESSTDKQTYQLKAAGRYLQERNPSAAIDILSKIDTSEMPTELSSEKVLLEAYLAALTGQADHSLSLLKMMPNKTLLPNNMQIAYHQTAAMAYQQNGDTLASAKSLITLDELLPSEQKSANEEKIWYELNALPLANIQDAEQYTPQGVTTGWLSLAYIANAYKNDPRAMQSEITSWWSNYPNHPASHIASNLLQGNDNTNELNTITNDNFALLLPTSGQLTNSSQAIRDGFMAAYYKQEQLHPDDDEQTIHVYNTSGKSIKDLYSQAVSEGASTIVGPLTKSQVATLKHVSISKPTLALNFTPGGSNNKSLVQFALSPQDEAVQVAEKAWQDGTSNALIIAPDSQWGQGVAKTFQNAWVHQGGQVIDSLTYTNKTHFDKTIKKVLKVNDQTLKAMTHDTAEQQNQLAPIHRQDVDMIFLVASPVKAREIIPMLKFYYANDIPVYATSYVYSGTPNPSLDKDLEGLKFCDIPLVLDNSPHMERIRKKMTTLINPSETELVRLYAFGMDAYNLTNHYNELQNNNFSLPGMTGTLYLGKHQQVLRELQWAEFKNGKPVKISGINA